MILIQCYYKSSDWGIDYFRVLNTWPHGRVASTKIPVNSNRGRVAATPKKQKTNPWNPTYHPKTPKNPLMSLMTRPKNPSRTYKYEEHFNIYLFLPNFNILHWRPRKNFICGLVASPEFYLRPHTAALPRGDAATYLKLWNSQAVFNLHLCLMQFLAHLFFSKNKIL